MAGPRTKIGRAISLSTSAFRRTFAVLSDGRTVAELLHALAAVMAELNVRWYLFGAQAAIIWGSPRLSADADVTADLDPADVDRFIDASF